MKTIFKNFLKALFIALFLMTSLCQAQEWTVEQKIGGFEYGQGAYYFSIASGSSGWGASNCPGAYWIYVPAGSGAKDMANMILAAHGLDKPVSFYGDCLDAVYFTPLYVWAK